MAITPNFNDAVSLLQAMEPMEATRICANDIDLNQFLADNRLDLSPEDRQELKSLFRG